MATSGKNVLILDAGVQQGFAQGELNHHYVALASELLTAHGFNVTVTRVEEQYDKSEEVAKIAAADLIIVQTPGFWMSIPWQLKKYIDEIFGDPELCGGDGRHRADASCKYGSGGFLTKKCYLISSTWNAPLEAFIEPNQFFEGRGIDGLFMPLHKTFEFLGVQALPSFMANDVLKNPVHEQDFARFKAHLLDFVINAQ